MQEIIFLRVGKRLNFDPLTAQSLSILNTFIMYFWIIFVIVNYDYQDLKTRKFIKCNYALLSYLHSSHQKSQSNIIQAPSRLQ